MHNCDNYQDVASQYVCPTIGGGKNRGKGLRHLSQLGGSCLYGGSSSKSMKGGALCNLGNNFLDSSSLSGEEMYKYGDCVVQSGGDGYSLMPGRPVGGQPGFMRYSDTCRPVFPGEILPKKVGGGKRLGLISRMVGGMDECNNQCKIKIPMNGGSVSIMGSAVTTLGDLLAPMGKNSLIALIILLFGKYLVSRRKMTKGQMGGNMMEYTKIFLPMSKNNLLALASLLLIHYFVKNKRSKLQRGGSMMKEMGNLLAPLGVNALGASVILLLLRVAVNKGRKKKEKQRGGMDLVHPLIDLVAPLGISAFTATGILVLLEKMFKLKMNKAMGKAKKGSSVSSMMKDLKSKLSKLK